MRIVQTKQNEMEPEPRIGLVCGRSSFTAMIIKTSCTIAALLTVVMGLPFNSVADNPPPLVYTIENTGTNYPPPPLPTLPNLPLIQSLPDPFNWANDALDMGGTRSTNFSDWEHHRNEIMAQIENYEIGTKPAVDSANVSASYSGGTLTVRVTNYVSGVAKTLTLTCAVSIPAGTTPPYRVCIGMDSPYGSLNSSDFTSRHIVGITYSESQVSTYGNSPSASDPYYKLYPSLLGHSGQYSAWAWGVSRVIDGLTLVTNLPVDLKHICVTGCSYAGKLALFSGAFDERVALTIAQESGGGGANSWRYNHTEQAGTVEDIDNTDYSWFMQSLQNNFSGNNVSYLPEDHHELMAMCAPRALYCTGNTDYTWLGNPSCYVCGQACAEIYNNLGIADRFGFNVDGGHGHCSFPADQEADVQYFLNKFMLDQTNLSQSITTSPNTVDFTSVDYARWTSWWGTTNPVLPAATIPGPPTLYLTIPTAATEGDGTLVGQGSLSVNKTSTNDMVVNLASGNTSKVTVPASVVIPAGQTNVVFDLTIIDNSVLDGDQAVTITASSTFAANTPKATIIVYDNETATLSVTLPASAYESAGTLVNAGSLSIGTAPTANITVYLTSSDPSRLTLPPATVILAGKTSAVFNLTFVSNNIIEGPQNVTVTAHVRNWTDGIATMTILDDNPLPDHFAWNAISSPQLIGAPFQVTITAQDVANNTLDFRLPVTLSALVVGNAPGTNTILNSPSPEQSLNDGTEYVLGYSFTPSTNLMVTHVRHYFGDKVSIWTASGQLLASQNVVSVPGTWVDTPLLVPLLLLAGDTYLLTAHENGVDYFYSQDLPTTFPDGTINQSYWDSGDVFPAQQDDSRWYFVDLRYAKDVAVVPINPGVTTNFSGGTWSGNVSVLQAATNVLLQASVSEHSGVSIPFNVLGTPVLAITAFSNSVVLSWPVAAAGFTLEQASTLPNWTADPGTPAIVGDHYGVTNALDATHIYYRLRKP